jgi:ACDE family multidrug resistance protein
MLFALESFARSLLTTVIPLEALRLLGDAQRVSLVFFLASSVSLCGTFAVPVLVRRIPRRWIYSGGASLLVLASALLAVGAVPTLLAGMIARVLGVVTMTIVVNLYIMDHIDRRELGRTEPLRLFYSAGAWTLGPALGVYLGTRVDPVAPYILSGTASLAALAYFWVLRLTDQAALAAPRRPAPSPWHNLRQFFAQPRLVFAWSMAIGRNSWWVMFYIYGPIYAVQSGLGEMAGGLLASAGTGFLFLMPVLGRFARTSGVRRVLVLGFGTAGIATLVAAALMQQPLLASAGLLVAALGLAAIDAIGNVPFMLAVRPHQRPEMTAVYSTFRDIADLATPGAFAVVLHLFALPAVFVASGLTMVGLSLAGRQAHPRLGLFRAPLRRDLGDASTAT